MLRLETEERRDRRRDVAMRDAAIHDLSLGNSRAHGQEAYLPSTIISTTMVLKSVHPHTIQIAAVIRDDDQDSFPAVLRQSFDMLPEPGNLLVGVSDGLEIK